MSLPSRFAVGSFSGQFLLIFFFLSNGLYFLLLYMPCDFLLLKIECLNINNMVTLEIRFPRFPGVCYFLFLYIWAGGLILRDISVLKISLMCKIVDFSFLSLLLDISVFVVSKCSTIMSGSQRGKRKKMKWGRKGIGPLYLRNSLQPEEEGIPTMEGGAAVVSCLCVPL